MPELPEVETIRRGIEPHILGKRIEQLVVRQPKLRWAVPSCLAKELQSTYITQVARRAKYLLLSTDGGTILIHLGMSGRLRVMGSDTPPQVHDHIDLILTNETMLRFTDPRRFGAWLWTDQNPDVHPLLAGLGPEPRGSEFSGYYLFRRSRGRRLAVKSFLMDSHVVVGLGNIYANESLFAAGIHPNRRAGRISRKRYDELAAACRNVLNKAIRQGGTTLRDFTNGEGKPGYFQQSLQVYGLADAACPTCSTPIRETRIGQRSTFYCPRCQR
jgi:formamidopyrimidine-DNA glycosylase